MHRALYRTWRPQTFDDVCGQGQITDILKYQVSEGKTSHAYLFCGSRGTGKTSCAKILAKAVNCLHPVNGNPCNECEACRAIDAGTATDVIEMDAASNNGVDNVRDLKEEIVFMPAIMKYRVYIIDEVHMMSASAFNALLKTLEEPPAYVLFILATTELSKLPSTIVSRCQRCDFRRIATDVIVARLTKIAGVEGMSLTPDGARMIARAAQGGMRDAVSLLELCGGTHTKIDEALVSQLLGAGNRSTLYATVEAIAARDYETIYKIVDDLVMSSGDLTGFWSGLGDVYRDMIVAKTIPGAKEYLDLTDSEYERLEKLRDGISMARLNYCSQLIEQTMPALQKTGISRRATVEIALTRMCDPNLSTSPEALLARLDELEREVKLLHMGIGTAAPITQGTAPIDGGQKQTTESVSEPMKKAVPTATPTVNGGKTKINKSESTGTVPGQATIPTAGITPAVADGLPAREWRGVCEEFASLFPGYSTLFHGSSASVGEGGVLLVTAKDSILFVNFEQDARAMQALSGLTGRAIGKILKGVKVIKTGAGEPAAPFSEDTFF